MKFKDLSTITFGELLSYHEDLLIGEVVYDTRLITTAISSDDVFVAINGSHHDGNQFIADAFQKGIRQFIVETEKIDPSILDASNVLLVHNSIEALQKIATVHRSSFDIPVIAITGSNGKTVVKEWLSTLLQSSYMVVKSPASFNSQLGAALSILNITDQHSIGVFEAGISMKNEMEKLAKIIAPTIGIFTNIGTAHEDGFDTITEKIREKALLFSQSKTIIYTDYQPEVVEIIESMYGSSQKQLIKWGELASMGIRFVAAQAIVSFNGNESTYQLPFTDPISRENLGHCLALLTILEISPAEIQHGLYLLRNISKRLSIKKGVNNSILLDDSYNNDTAGLRAAMTFISLQQPEHPLKVILSDILQTSKTDELYMEVAEIITRHKVSEVLTVGKEIKKLSQHLAVPVSNFPDTDTLLANLKGFPDQPSRILVKGARPFKFEKIVSRLSEKIHGTRLEMNMHNLVHNLNCYRSVLKPGTKIMAMVKAFAYGSSSLEVARLLAFHHIDYLGVAYADEGFTLRKNGIKVPILVMNPSVSAFSKMIENQLEPEIFNIELLRTWGNVQAVNKPGIHIKIDSGMHRLGFYAEQLDEVARLVKKYELHVASIFSHLAGADNPSHDDFTRSQIHQFEIAANNLVSAIGQDPLVHLLNSSGIARFPEHQLDMVRLGIGLQGFDPAGILHRTLLPVGKLLSTVSHIQQVSTKETVGYDRKGVLTVPSRIATIAIGYADGFRRSLGNGLGTVAIRSENYPTIGNICMDMTMIDVTNSEVEVGDEVEIFGPNISLEAVADAANTIPYEILTSISPRVERVFLYD